MPNPYDDMKLFDPFLWWRFWFGGGYFRLLLETSDVAAASLRRDLGLYL